MAEISQEFIGAALLKAKDGVMSLVKPNDKAAVEVRVPMYARFTTELYYCYCQASCAQSHTYQYVHARLHDVRMHNKLCA